MCGRFTLTAPARLARDLGAAAPADAAPRYNVAPTQRVLVVVGEHGRRAVVTRAWGLRPRWATAPLINARLETVATRPTFRDAFRDRRCLVAADGFYEWRREGGRRVPFLLARADHRVVGLAAVWEDDACAILTGPADARVAPIHDRMPLVVPPAAIDAWLDPALPAARARALPTGEAWRLTPVSTWVNHVAHDDPRCVAPVADGTS